MGKRSIITTIIISVILYAVSTGVSYAIFNVVKNKTVDTSITSPVDSKKEDKKAKFVVDPSLPRNEGCPLNGMYYTKKEKEKWDKRRPLAVMIENSVDARPQSGLSLADIVYEAVAEGGITRFMGVYYCGAALGDISLAPVRSARTYFIDWVSEYDALYNHVGEANRLQDNIYKTDPRADADSQISQYGIKDMDQFGLPYVYQTKSGSEIKVCYRNPDRLDHEVATEHTMICESDSLYIFAQEEKGWTNVDEDGVAWDKNFVSWKFKDDAKLEDRPESFTIEFGFWDGYKDFDVRWVYDKQNNVYKRFNAGVEHIDLETDEQLTAKNVIVQFSKEQDSVDENKHTLYQTIGQGTALVFQDGKAISANWQKKTRLSRTIFTDVNGKEIKFNRGQIWIEIVAQGNKVTY